MQRKRAKPLHATQDEVPKPPPVLMTVQKVKEFFNEHDTRCFRADASRY